MLKKKIHKKSSWYL